MLKVWYFYSTICTDVAKKKKKTRRNEELQMGVFYDSY